MEYALANGLIKFVQLTTKEPQLRDICRFEEEKAASNEVFQRQTIDCESELIRAKQMNYFPMTKANDAFECIGITNLNQASQVKLNCICIEVRQQSILIYREFQQIQIKCEICSQ